MFTAQDLRQVFETVPRRPGEKRVRFIPVLDCSLLATAAPLPVRQAAFIWGFSDDAAATAELAAMSSLKELRAFVQECEDKLVFVFDQWEVMEHDRNLKALLKSISQRRYEIRVTSAGGGELAAELDSMHGEAFLYQVKGGLEEVSFFSEARLLQSNRHSF